jgi:adenylate cyclase class 2
VADHTRGVETEVKIQVRDVATIRDALRGIGAELVHERVLEDNTLYDDPARRLTNRGEVLRVRRLGERGVLTFKGPRREAVSGIKSRTELETTIGDPARAGEILAALGFVPRFRYQKYRETWSWGGCEIVVDETPVGPYIEIEGTEDEIHAAARALGYGPDAYVSQSYAALFLAAGGRGDMLFPEGDRS